MVAPATDREISIWLRIRGACKEGILNAEDVGFDRWWYTNSEPGWMDWILQAAEYEEITPALHHNTRMGLRNAAREFSEDLDRRLHHIAQDRSDSDLMEKFSGMVRRGRWMDLEEWASEIEAAFDRLRQDLYYHQLILRARISLEASKLEPNIWGLLPYLDQEDRRTISGHISKKVSYEKVSKMIGKALLPDINSLYWKYLGAGL